MRDSMYSEISDGDRLKEANRRIRTLEEKNKRLRERLKYAEAVVEATAKYYRSAPRHPTHEGGHLYEHVVKALEAFDIFRQRLERNDQEEPPIHEELNRVMPDAR